MRIICVYNTGLVFADPHPRALGLRPLPHVTLPYSSFRYSSGVMAAELEPEESQVHANRLFGIKTTPDF